MMLGEEGWRQYIPPPYTQAEFPVIVLFKMFGEECSHLIPPP
jgi:hypothetical protein